MQESCAGTLTRQWLIRNISIQRKRRNYKRGDVSVSEDIENVQSVREKIPDQGGPTANWMSLIS
jgi:hypothetical protein